MCPRSRPPHRKKNYIKFLVGDFVNPLDAAWSILKAKFQMPSMPMTVAQKVPVRGGTADTSFTLNVQPKTPVGYGVASPKMQSQMTQRAQSNALAHAARAAPSVGQQQLAGAGVTPTGAPMMAVAPQRVRVMSNQNPQGGMQMQQMGTPQQLQASLPDAHQQVMPQQMGQWRMGAQGGLQNVPQPYSLVA